MVTSTAVYFIFSVIFFGLGVNLFLRVRKVDGVVASGFSILLLALALSLYTLSDYILNLMGIGL